MIVMLDPVLEIEQFRGTRVYGIRLSFDTRYGEDTCDVRKD